MNYIKHEKLEEAVCPSFENLLHGHSIWQPQMDAISAFYKKYFSIDIDWTKITLPKWTKERPRLELILPQVTGQMYIDCYKEEFGKNSVVNNSYSKDLEKNIKAQQARTTEPYAFAWTGEIECDVEWRKKPYNEIKDTTATLMIPKEGILCALRFGIETSQILDEVGVTCFHSLCLHHSPLSMYGKGNSQFCVDYGDMSYRFPLYGYRQIITSL